MFRAPGSFTSKRPLNNSRRGTQQAPQEYSDDSEDYFDDDEDDAMIDLTIDSSPSKSSVPALDSEQQLYRKLVRRRRKVSINSHVQRKYG